MGAVHRIFEALDRSGHVWCCIIASFVFALYLYCRVFFFAGIRLSAELSVYRHSLVTVQHFKIPVIGFPTFFGSQSFPVQRLL
jgi:hypothetical protein